jgi:hypothetical protein
MLLLLLIDYFHLFVNCIHNVSLQEEVVDMWQIKESKANVGIQSFIRYVILKNWDESQYADNRTIAVILLWHFAYTHFTQHVLVNIWKLTTSARYVIKDSTLINGVVGASDFLMMKWGLQHRRWDLRRSKFIYWMNSNINKNKWSAFPRLIYELAFNL